MSAQNVSIITHREDGDFELLACLRKPETLSDASFAAVCETVRLLLDGEEVLYRQDMPDVITPDET